MYTQARLSPRHYVSKPIQIEGSKAETEAAGGENGKRGIPNKWIDYSRSVVVAYSSQLSLPSFFPPLPQLPLSHLDYFSNLKIIDPPGKRFGKRGKEGN